MATVIARETLPHSATAYQFQGEQFGAVGVSFFIVDAPPVRRKGRDGHAEDAGITVVAGRGHGRTPSAGCFRDHGRGRVRWGGPAVVGW